MAETGTLAVYGNVNLGDDWVDNLLGLNAAVLDQLGLVETASK